MRQQQFKEPDYRMVSLATATTECPIRGAGEFSHCFKGVSTLPYVKRKTKFTKNYNVLAATQHLMPKYFQENGRRSASKFDQPIVCSIFAHDCRLFCCSYDYLVFWKDEAKTESWHPRTPKFSGTGGACNFPGFGGRPPLVIESDR